MDAGGAFFPFGKSGVIGCAILFLMIDPKILLPPHLVSLIAEIDEFKGRWHSHGLQSLFKDGRLWDLAF